MFDKKYDKGCVLMDSEKIILKKVKEYLTKEIACLKKQENEYDDAADIDIIEETKASCKREVRAELECLQDIIKSWEAI